MIVRTSFLKKIKKNTKRLILEIYAKIVWVAKIKYILYIVEILSKIVVKNLLNQPSLGLFFLIKRNSYFNFFKRSFFEDHLSDKTNLILKFVNFFLHKLDDQVQIFKFS